MFGLERRVNTELGFRALRWEEDIRGQGFNPLAVFRFHYYTTAYFFIIIAVLAASYGMWMRIDLPALLRVGWPLSFGVGITLTVNYVLHHLRKYDFPDKSWPKTIPDERVKTDRKNKRPA